MECSLTQHAQDVLEKRRISHQWVERVISAPEWAEPDSIDEDLEHRLAAIPEFQDRILRVIVNTKTDPLRVITAYFDRRRRRS